MIDGVLDDEVWATAAHLTEFTQQAPLDGTPATEATDVLIAYDSEKIYFGFHARYEDPTIMRANRVERDRAFQDDLITLYFDTFMDQQRGYEFDVNGFGVQGEGVISGGGGGDPEGGPVLEHALRYWRSDRRGWFHGRDGDPLQEPTVSKLAGWGVPPLGTADRKGSEGKG